jgi:hypothetical protein
VLDGYDKENEFIESEDDDEEEGDDFDFGEGGEHDLNND